MRFPGATGKLKAVALEAVPVPSGSITSSSQEVVTVTEGDEP